MVIVDKYAFQCNYVIQFNSLDCTFLGVSEILWIKKHIFMHILTALPART